MNRFILPSVASLFIQACLIAAPDPLNEVTLSAHFVLQNGVTQLRSNANANIALVFENKTDKILFINCCKMKGKEQLHEDPRPVLREGVVPSYVATILVQFFDESGNSIHTERVILTSSGEIVPGKKLVSLITVKLPIKTGIYRVTLGQIEPAKVGMFGSQTTGADDLSLWVNNASLVVLKDIPVR